MAGKDSDFVLQKMGVNTGDIATISKGVRGGQDLYKGTFGKFVKGSKGGKSIIGMAAKNTFEFPVFVSSSVPLDYATATCSLLEQNYASYLQIAIAQNPVVDIRDIKSGGYLSQFKTNTTKYVEYAEAPYEFESCHNVVTEDDKIFEFDMISIEDEEARFINEMCSYEPLSEFDHREVIQLRREVNAANGKDKKEEYEAKLKLLKAEANDFEKYKDPEGKDMFPDVERHEANKRLKTQAEWQKLQQEIKKLEADLDVDENGSTYGSEVANRRSKLKADVIKAASDAAHAEQRFEMEKRRGARDLMAKAPEIMDESKINKLNTLKPLMMKCQVRVSNPSGEVTEYPMELVLGVKCHCRLIDAETLPEVAKYPIKEMNELTRKVKYKAGELKFFKDIVFNIKEKKQSAIDNRDPKKRWYRRLYKLAHMKGDSFVSASISGNKRSGLIPNATMIITNSDVENVKAATESE